MITVMTLLRTKVELTDAVIEANTTEIKRQANVSAPVEERVFNRIVDSTQKAIDYPRGTIELDVIGQFQCRDVSAGMSAADAGGLDLAMGLTHIMESAHPILCLQNTIIAPPSGAKLCKRMSLLRKREDVTSEQFQEEWFGLHAQLVKRLPLIKGYRQNLVIDGARDEAGNMMVDGVVELWFEDVAAIESTFASPSATTLMTHAREFIGEISTFMVDPMALG